MVMMAMMNIKTMICYGADSFNLYRLLVNRSAVFIQSPARQNSETLQNDFCNISS